MPFLSDITLGQYYPIESFIHRLDPRTKLIVTIIIMTALLVTYNFFGLLIVTVLLFLGIRLSKIPASLITRNLRPFLWLFIITLFIHIIFSEKSTNIVEIPFINIGLSKQGIINGFSYSLRLALLILFAAILTLTTSPVELTDALEVMLGPLKRFGLPTHELTMMMTLSLRFIPTLIMEADKLRKAQISRGVSFQGNLIKRVKNVIPLIIPLFISVFRRADELALAMDSRCYTGGTGRTRYKELTFNKHDYYVIIFSGFIFLITIFVQQI